LQGIFKFRTFAASKLKKRINMNLENVKSQMRKGVLEYCILLILNREPAYSNDIIRILQETGLLVVEGTLYPLLSRLKNTNMLNYQWIESTQGPPRKYYALTDLGKAFLVELGIAWEETSNAIRRLKEL
jgi:PadR family transcriptional regulator PadR